MMKKFQKIAGVLLAAVLFLVMSAGAFAAEPEHYTITLKAPEESSVSLQGCEYSAYRLFDLTYNAAGKYAYTVTGEFAEFVYSADGSSYQGEELVNYAETLTSGSDALNALGAAALDYAQQKGIAPAAQQAAGPDGTTLDVGRPGWYLVAGSAAAEGEQTVTAACALTTADPAAEVKVKVDAPSLEKIIRSGDTANGTSASVGDVVEFRLTSRVPLMTGYSTYDFQIVDTLSDGLTFVRDSEEAPAVTVSIGGVPSEEYDATLEGNTLTITFRNFIRNTPGDVIVVDYAATLNENALEIRQQNNTAVLRYSNNPYNSASRGTTPGQTIYVHDFGLKINKVEKDGESKPLAGAQFILSKKAEGGTLYYYLTAQKTVGWTTEKASATVVTTADDGSAAFNGLDEGTYALEETCAPAGYSLLKEPVEVRFAAAYAADGTLTVDHTQTVTVVNIASQTLPMTGGSGTTIFYLAGGGLVVLAAVMLLWKKYADSHEKK